MCTFIGSYFKAANDPLIVSNACISGMLGIITAKRLIESGNYKNVVVSGGDIISEFTISGFQSFKAISPEPCKPYDAFRAGVTLGEACGTLVLSSNSFHSNSEETLIVAGAATSNDANHISGPSRDGEGLYLSIRHAITDAGILPSEIDYISGHGTATVYNDEMESKAIALAGIEHAPVNSFKGYFGHTLGAAGLIETICTIHSLKENILIRSAGFKTLGVSTPLKVVDRFQAYKMRHSVKTGAGFGGCNAAIVLSKI